MKVNNVQNRFLPIPESVKKGLEPEAKISDFEIKKELGSGSFGRVFLVVHKVTKVLYAIKAIDKRNKTNQEEAPYFKREIEIMYKIRHPNVVRLYGHFEDDKYIYFVMEYISKGNIFNLIPKDKSKTPSNDSVANIMKDVISAVYFLHNMYPPIIHRDIKPENVLLAEGNIAKLTDFGWSNYMSVDEVRKTICGTPIYLAPEIFSDKGHDEKVDIWCIGVLLFELCTGSVPFMGNDLESLKYNIQHMNISWPKNIDLEAKNLIGKILKQNPSERLTIPQILSHQFFSNVISDVNKYLIKPDPDMVHRPFIISKDDPKNEEELIKQYASGHRDNIVKAPSEDYDGLKREYDELLKKYTALCNKANELRILESQKNELSKECDTIKDKIREQDKIIATLSSSEKEENKADEKADAFESSFKINELEAENSELRDKCEKYERNLEQKKYPKIEKKINELRQTMSENNQDKFKKEMDDLKEEIDEEKRKHFILILNEKDKELNKIKEDLPSLIDKEKKKYSAILTKYESACKSLKKENEKLKKQLEGK